MGNKFDLMQQAIAEARHTMAAADSQADNLARLLAEPGRLRRVNRYTLRRLKRELRNFNMVTGEWNG